LASIPHKLNELEIVQNPSLGGYLIWQCGLSFQSEVSLQPSFPLAFLVLPLILHRPTLDLVTSTRKTSGLALFAAKVGEEQENLLAIHERARVLRGLSLQSVAFAINYGLIHLNYAEATFRSNTLTKKGPSIPERIKSMSAGAGKLGYWFSRMTLHQIATTLKVDF
jgi:hypothetical protein